mmetsp:Transcript_56200/g.99315  ORF Transcript_56200/g.99315 Transcript_56200/m.99315 type:complete len:236 (-) Transcript_56200:2-709(-)
MVQVVALTRALADASEHGVTTVSFGNIVDQLHNHDGLADTGTAEQTDLATFRVRLNKINNLDASREHLLLSRLLGEDWGLLVDGIILLRVNRATLIDGFANDVHDAAKRALANWNRDRLAHVNNFLAAHQTLGRVHRNRADSALSEMLSDFKNEADLVALDLERVEDRWQVAVVELNVDDGTDDLSHLAKLCGGRSAHAAGMAGEPWAVPQNSAAEITAGGTQHLEIKILYAPMT